MHGICTDFTSKVRIFSKICNVFNNIKRENQPSNWLVFYVLALSREWDSNPRPFRYEIKTTNYNILIISVMDNTARICLHGCCTDF